MSGDEGCEPAGFGSGGKRRGPWLQALKGAGFVGLLVLHSLVSCGRVGPPIPPGDIGIAKKLEQERQREDSAAGQVEGVSHTEREDGIVLPPLRPLGSK